MQSQAMLTTDANKTDIADDEMPIFDTIHNTLQSSNEQSIQHKYLRAIPTCFRFLEIAVV